MLPERTHTAGDSFPLMHTNSTHAIVIDEMIIPETCQCESNKARKLQPTPIKLTLPLLDYLLQKQKI